MELSVILASVSRPTTLSAEIDTLCLCEKKLKKCGGLNVFGAHLNIFPEDFFHYMVTCFLLQVNTQTPHHLSRGPAQTGWTSCWAAMWRCHLEGPCSSSTRMWHCSPPTSKRHLHTYTNDLTCNSNIVSNHFIQIATQRQRIRTPHRLDIIHTSRNTHPPCIMEKRKLCFVFELFRFGKFHVVPLGVHEFLHEGDICGFGKPALLVQQSQDAWRVVLQRM